MGFRFSQNTKEQKKKKIPLQEKNNNKKTKAAFLNLKKAALYAKKIGLDVHAGHGLTYQSAHKISKIKSISEFNIGHFIIAESLFIGLKNSIKKLKKIINT